MSADKQFERDLIKRLNQGDLAAFERLYTEKHQHVYAYCLTLIRSEELAEEVMLDVFVTVWKKRDHIQPDLSLNALLFKITKDLSFNCLKKVARERAFRRELLANTIHPVANPTEAQLLSQEYATIADRAINQLPPQRKLIFTMRRRMGMSYEEIADQLGISKNTVKVQLVKAVKCLRKYMATHADISFFLLLSAIVGSLYCQCTEPTGWQ